MKLGMINGKNCYETARIKIATSVLRLASMGYKRSQMVANT